ncbi:HlyD family secretion protein [Poseidonocella pacifica]|uniref:Membrane fusion protein (MFP) family protein n=1 Tax=Poseidonocella pacifica TaxID=871651 RepID=A0A1I0XZZ7_9RHOB|nr:HlyD family type I secretion periplasmic adaptor subunit [Poseidonocella pacifica]SFB06552.1 HlyD family secretion protein [Poseidonocella pacifica]
MNGGAWSARGHLLVGVIALIVLVGGFGTWATFTTISGAIIAQGRIEVDQNRQVVQHPDGGVVEEIIVDEGDEVAAGDLLIRLEPTQLRSELSVVENQLYEILARIGRLEAERDDAEEITFDPLLLEAAAENESFEKLVDGQQRLFTARRSSIASEIDQLRKRRRQTESQIEGIDAQQASLQTQLGLIREELANQQSLLDRGLAQASSVLALRREEASLSGSVGELTAQRAQAEGRITEIEIQILNLGDKRREEAITQLRDLSVNELETGERRRTLVEQLDRLDIRAPVSGIVYGLTVFTPRSVIRPADPVLYLVPQDRPLVIAAQIEPIDIDKIRLDQEVVLRFSTFDQRTTPELLGTVTQISADAFTDERSTLTYYRAEIRLSEGEQAKLPDGITLIPGMPVETFLRTQDRSPLAYLVKPLTDYLAKAFRDG